jgi:copper oxidase (laccase) domain-containing protein
MIATGPGALPLETFPALGAIAGVRHGFTGRVAGLEVKADRELALQRLDASHAAARMESGLGNRVFITGEQVHGRAVATVDAASRAPIPQVDGLITADPGVCLGIYVADCCAVYLVDPRRRVAGLLHSGRRGSESGITGVAIERMRAEFGCNPADITVQLSPCIRPPNYEVDFAAMIVAQCREAGVGQVVDCGVCTATHLDRYYSYRAEKGKTGRMLAFLGFEGV